MRCHCISAAVLATAGVAAAQPFSATLAFEASTDGGASWHGGQIELPNVPVNLLVRLRLDWTPEAGYALAGMVFDGVIHDAAPGDSASGFVRPSPFDERDQIVVASRFGTDIKIDDSRDTLPPDAGNRNVYITQTAQDFNPNFDASRPLTAFLMEVALDGTEGVRVVDALVARHPGTFERELRIYTSPSGQQRSIVVGRVATLSINVVPSSGALSLLVPAMFAALRRRRGAR